LIGAVTGERGIVGTCAGRAKARGDGDLAVALVVLVGVVVADAVKVVVDSNGLRREGRSLLLKVALKVTDWLTTGVVLDAVRVRWVGLPLSGVVTLIVTTLLVDA